MKNWSLSKKIWAVMGILSFAFVVSSAMSLRELLRSKDALNEITDVLVKRDQLTSEIKDDQRRIMIMTLETIARNDAASLARLSKEYVTLLADTDADIDAYEKIASPQGKEILGKYKEKFKVYIDASKKAQALGALNKNEEAEAAIFGADGIRAEMRGYLDDMNKETEASLEKTSKETNASASQAIVTNALISILSILSSLIIAFFVLRSLTRSIAEVVGSLFDSSAQVSSAASQIASSSEELSQAATEQAASLEETAASIEEMNSMVGKNSENAKSTASTSGKSQEKATLGKAVVEKMIQSMDAINESNSTIMVQVNRSNDSIASIVKVIEEIGNKTKVINDIVFQTKLLSFNASVEAARAGEHGKGFAVVAEEVGNLAQMSGNAAKEISTLLEESVQKVNQIVLETKSSVEKLISEGKQTVEQGAQVARQCGEVLEEIVTNVSSVSSMAVEIASASEEQSRGVNEITKAMSQLDQMTQQNAATSEECASAAEELSAQSESLKRAVNQLVSTVNGSDGKGDREEHSEVRRAPVVRHHTAAPKVAASNVVHMKAPKESSSSAQPMRRASGDAPAYNSSGFEDV